MSVRIANYHDSDACLKKCNTVRTFSVRSGRSGGKRSRDLPLDNIHYWDLVPDIRKSETVLAQAEDKDIFCLS